VSRSGYDDYYDGDDYWDLIRWRGAVQSAIRGRRGQAFLRDMLTALDELPAPRLICGYLYRDGPEGGVCALGAVGLARGMDMTDLDSYDREQVAIAFAVAPALAAELSYINDESSARPESPDERWVRVRAWVVASLLEKKEQP